MYTGTADHALTAELVALVDVPVIASGDIMLARGRRAVLARTGATAVMVGRGAQGNPWALARDGRRRRRRAVARGGDRRAGPLRARDSARARRAPRAGFLKKFYGWYLGRGRFPSAFKQELLLLDSTEEIERRLLAAAPGAFALVERARGEIPSGDEVTLELPVSIYGGG